MNKFLLVLLAIFGGIEVVFYIFTPIVISIFWVYLIGLETWTSYFFFVICLLATLFRAIKIGFLKK